MRGTETPFGKSASCRRSPAPGRAALVAFLLLATSAKAESPAKSPQPQSGAELNTITVEGRRDRAILERRVKAFVSGITTAPYQDSLARWQKETPICPLVAGLPHDDGEYMLSRLSQIATSAGASLAPRSCKPNFYVIVTSVPDELIAAWSKRNPFMFGNTGGTKIRQFLNASTPVRVWYNAELVNWDGTPCTKMVTNTPLNGFLSCGDGGHVIFGAVRDLASVIVLVDARRAKGVNFGQLAAYVAMVGLAEIRGDAKVGDAPTILRLFADSANAPALGMSAWDTAYLKALYHTQHEDKTQLLAMKTSIIKEITLPPDGNNARK
jgi:hypothetical protein